MKTNVTLLTPEETRYFNTAKSVYGDFKKAVKQYKKDSVQVHKKLLKEMIRS